jgi:hypothetical protein
MILAPLIISGFVAPKLSLSGYLGVEMSRAYLSVSGYLGL